MEVSTMARTTPRPVPTEMQTLQPLLRHCPTCGEPLWATYHNYRTITTLTAVLRLTLQIRRCLNTACPQCRQPYRPEEEGRLALPKHEFGLELMALSLQDTLRLQRLTKVRGRVILALDGLQPDVGHEVLWVLRDCLSGEVLLARSLLSATQDDLAILLREVKEALQVPIVGVITDGQHSIRAAVAQALPDVPHQLCHFHYLREAAKPIYEADRHAKKTLKKRVRGIRPIERKQEGRTDPEAEIMRGYCSAVRSALTDEGRPPLAASGLTLHTRLSTIAESLARVAKRGPCPRNWNACRPSSSGGCMTPRPCGPTCR